MQYSIAFGSVLEAASDVISGKTVEHVGVTVLVKFCVLGQTNRSWVTRVTHFVTDDERNNKERFA